MTDEALLESVALIREYGNPVYAARATGKAQATLRRHRDMALARGLIRRDPVIPGFEIVATTSVLDQSGNLTREYVKQRPADERGPFNLPEGHAIKGVSALLDGNGNVSQQWVKTKQGELDPIRVAERLKEIFEGYTTPVEPTPLPGVTHNALLNLIPCNDWHINMLAWGREVGENWDLSIAEQTIGNSMVEAINRAPAAGTSIILGGGDLLHADSNDNRTAKSGHALDADSRHQKGLETALRLKVRVIDAALERSEHVIVRILPGNHDEMSSVAVSYFLLAYYRNEPRVTVQAEPSLFFWHRFGVVLIGATHGHTVKLQDMAQIMAHRRAEDWGKTRFRYVHGFHVHHRSKFVSEGEGVVMESHQAPVPQDAWHYGSGYLSGRSVQVVTYHDTHGEIGRVRVAIMDGEQ